MKLFNKRESSPHTVPLVLPFFLIVLLFLAAAAGIVLRAAALISRNPQVPAASLLPYLAAVCVLAVAALFFIFLIYRPFWRFLKLLTNFMENIPHGNQKDLPGEFALILKPLRYREALELSQALNGLMKWSDELNLNYSRFNLQNR